MRWPFLELKIANTSSVDPVKTLRISYILVDVKSNDKSEEPYEKAKNRCTKAQSTQSEVRYTQKSDKELPQHTASRPYRLNSTLFCEMVTDLCPPFEKTVRNLVVETLTVARKGPDKNHPVAVQISVFRTSQNDVTHLGL